MIDRAALSKAMYGIHQPSFYLCGMTPEGEAWLLAGRSLGPDEYQMPLEVGMKKWSCCKACQRRSGKPKDEWPCDTVKLLLEAGVIDPLDVDLAAPYGSVQVDRHSRLAGVTNYRPDRKMEVLPYDSQL